MRQSQQLTRIRKRLYWISKSAESHRKGTALLFLNLDQTRSYHPYDIVAFQRIFPGVEHADIIQSFIELMVKIKICGITRLQDALDACHAGADALGFNFSHLSPRNISPEQARAIIKKLPPLVESAGIFVDQSPEEINSICRFCRLQIAQLHSERYTPQQAKEITEAKVIKVFRPKENFVVEEVFKFAETSGINAFLFDTFRPDMAGGTGERIGLSLAARIFNELGDSCYAILAGGLNKTNVEEAIRCVQPYGIDTASGVESAPGIKDKGKICSFFKTIREAGG